MKRMLARNCQNFFQRFLRRRRIRTLACSGLSIWMMPGLVELGDEPGQVLDRDRLRAVLPLERLLDVLEGLLAVELLEQEVLLDLEPEVLQRERVLDDVVGHPLVELGLDDQVGPELDLEVLGGLPEGRRGGQGGSGSSSVGDPRLRSVGSEVVGCGLARPLGSGVVVDARSGWPAGVRAHRAVGGGRRAATSLVQEDGHLDLQAGPELEVGVVELGADPHGGLGDGLDLGVDEGDLAAEPLLLDRQRLAAGPAMIRGWISTTWPSLTR